MPKNYNDQVGHCDTLTFTIREPFPQFQLGQKNDNRITINCLWLRLFNGKGRPDDVAEGDTILTPMWPRSDVARHKNQKTPETTFLEKTQQWNKQLHNGLPGNRQQHQSKKGDTSVPLLLDPEVKPAQRNTVETSVSEEKGCSKFMRWWFCCWLRGDASGLFVVDCQVEQACQGNRVCNAILFAKTVRVLNFNRW